MVGIAKRIKELRQKKTLTQERLGELIGVSLHTVFRWEKGDRVPSAVELSKLASALETSTGYLLGEVDDPRSGVKDAGSQEAFPSRPRRPKAAEDAEAIAIELMQKNPDLAVTFRSIRSNWGQLTDKDIEVLATGVQWTLGVADSKIDDKLKKKSRDGDL